ncbi:hypothetical protein Ga0466249_000375 [Sporomusaceae bacterium BoRhaA]|nr:hypothetical protein [Pelorhabdus rhamnosifermentans]
MAKQYGIAIIVGTYDDVPTFKRIYRIREETISEEKGEEKSTLQYKVDP